MGVHERKTTGCHFSESKKKKKLVPLVDRSNQQKVGPTMKSQCKRPFGVMHGFVEKKKDPFTNKLRPDIFYKVKMTAAVHQHTCELNTVFHRKAKQASGGTQPSLAGLQSIVEDLRIKPSMKAEDLRPKLMKCLPLHVDADAKCISNFRSHVATWILNNEEDEEVSFDDLKRLASKKPIAANELVVADSSLTRVNLRNMPKKTMQEDGSTWDALCHLQDLKKTLIGFDFRLKHDATGRPEAVCHMTAEMRCNLIRCGDILFLDSQKRQCNNQGWPHIGPAAKDCEMKVRCVTECVCIEEAHKCHCWVLLSASEMEPRWSFDSMRMTFADQHMTQCFIDALQAQRDQCPTGIIRLSESSRRNCAGEHQKCLSSVCQPFHIRTSTPREIN